jgi:hypothetical protein
MNDPIADELDRVLNFNGQPLTIHVPENATIRPGDGRHLLDGGVITFWTED